MRTLPRSVERADSPPVRVVSLPHDDTAEKALRRQVQLNGQETWEDIPDTVPPAAGGGAMSMPPVPGGVPGFTAGAEPPRWDGSSPQPRVMRVPNDQDDADYPQGRAVSPRPHAAFPSGPQGMDGYWPAGQPQPQAGTSSPGGATGVPPSTVGSKEPGKKAPKRVLVSDDGGKTVGPLASVVEKVGKEGYIHGWICVRPPCGKVGDEVKHPAHGSGVIQSVSADGDMQTSFADGFTGTLNRAEIGRYGAMTAGGDDDQPIVDKIMPSGVKRNDPVMWKSAARVSKAMSLPTTEIAQGVFGRQDDGNRFAEAVSHPDQYSWYPGTYGNVVNVRLGQPEDQPPGWKNATDGLESALRQTAVWKMESDWSLLSDGFQEAAAREFGIQDAGSVDEETADSTGTYRNLAVKQDFLRAQYDVTQADFKKRGITNVTLYRGFRFSADAVPEWVSEASDEKSDVPSPRFMPISSWSTSSYQARRFSRGENAVFMANPVSVVMKASVPASLIVSYPKSGMGMASEKEMTVLAPPAGSGSVQILRLANLGSKASLSDIIKVGKEGYIHGYICVRPPCGPQYTQATFDSGKGTVDHEGSRIGKMRKNANGTYSMTHTAADGTKTKLTAEHATRAEAALSVGTFHDVDVMHREADAGPAKDALGEAREALASGDDERATDALARARNVAVSSGDQRLASHINHVRSVLAGEDAVEPKAPLGGTRVLHADITPAGEHEPAEEPAMKSTAPLSDDPPKWLQDANDENQRLDEKIETMRSPDNFGFTPEGEAIRDQQQKLMYGDGYGADDDPNRNGALGRAASEGISKATQRKAMLLSVGARNRAHVAAENGLTPEAADAAMTTELKNAIAGRRVAMRVTNGSLGKIIDSGAFKTQFEVNWSAGLKSNDTRAKLEEAQFGYSAGLDPSLRPLYGYLDDGYDRPAGVGSKNWGDFNTDQLSSFGTTQVVFKDAVKQRSTFTVGDSMDSQWSSLPSRLSEPQPRSFAAFGRKDGGVLNPAVLKGMNRDYGSSEFRGNSFIEAQIHSPDGKARPLTTVDIDHVVFPTTPPADLRRKLADNGITWQVKNAKTIAKTGTTEEKTRMLASYQDDLARAIHRSQYYHRMEDKEAAAGRARGNWTEDIAAVNKTMAQLEANAKILEEAAAKST